MGSYLTFNIFAADESVAKTFADGKSAEGAFSKGQRSQDSRLRHPFLVRPRNERLRRAKEGRDQQTQEEIANCGGGWREDSAQLRLRDEQQF